MRTVRRTERSYLVGVLRHGLRPRVGVLQDDQVVGVCDVEVALAGQLVRHGCSPSTKASGASSAARTVTVDVPPAPAATAAALPCFARVTISRMLSGDSFSCVRRLTSTLSGACLKAQPW